MMTRFWCGLTLLTLLGCSGRPARIMPPDINAVQAGKDAIAEYDKNGNGAVDGAELAAVPAFTAAMKELDKNSDNQISADEITERINAWKASKIGIMSLFVRVMLDGKPLKNATVEFIPEKFLGPAVKPAKGVTGDDGSVACRVDDPSLDKRIAGAQCGFYKVVITGGDKTVPSKYNTSTTLGAEVAQDASWAQEGLTIDLSSR